MIKECSGMILNVTKVRKDTKGGMKRVGFQMEY